MPQASNSPDTSKLMEEAKLYWTVQTVIAPAVGYLLSHVDFSTGPGPKDFMFLALALMAIVVGAIYNLAGASYIHEARYKIAKLPAGRDSLCPWMAGIYLLIGGATTAFLLRSVSTKLRMSTDRALLLGFMLGIAFIWWVSKSTYLGILEDRDDNNRADLRKYLAGLKWLLLIPRR